MKKINYLALSAILIAAGCSAPEENKDKKALLAELKAEVRGLNAEIKSLEKEIAKEDPTFKKKNKVTLVTTLATAPQTFEHFVELRGKVSSDRNVSLTSEMPGVVKTVHVSEGDYVKKGQALISLDAAVMKNSIAELKTALDLATTVFEKQSNLWKQKIGTEIQYLQAKNNKESLERKLATLRAQLEQTVIRAPFSGTVDAVNAKMGEMAQPGMPVVRIVSLNKMYIQADVSENYIGKVQVGDFVEVEFPSLGKSLKTSVRSVSQVIDETNRTFAVEVSLPSSLENVKPNALAIVKIRDEKHENVLTVPTKLILNDSKGDFVFVVEGESAKKVYVNRGTTYKGATLIKSGLNAGQKVINDGFRQVANDDQVKEIKA